MAKLCACACGGAVIGGGAVHVAERPAGASYGHTKMVKRAERVRYASKSSGRVKRVVTTTSASCPPAVVTVANTPAPIPLGQPALVESGFVGGGGGAVPVVTGGGGGFFGGGGGGFFGGGFFGGSSGSSGSIVISSTSSGANVDVNNSNDVSNSGNNSSNVSN